MLFNSLVFALFLPMVLGVYWALRGSRRWQNGWLLAASYLFYGWWDWRFLGLIVGCSLVNFVAGRCLEATQRRGVRRLLLAACCVVCLGTLGVFKYYDFFVASFAALMRGVGLSWHPAMLHLALPVGISFFTFQAMSYTLDIYFGRLKPTRSLVDFLAFIAFFPQLVAGPIERASNLLPQFARERRFEPEAVIQGVTLMIYGLFKKMVVADTLGLYVDSVFRNYALYQGATCWIGALFFALQIYCDFSGYSDTARGVARLFGFRLMVNFDRPYLAASFIDFWRRWHISLSTWFKDYIYIPLGGSRAGTARTVRNLWVVFLLSGLWHGANWTFLVWGALHALFQTGAVLRRKVWPGSTAPQGVLGRVCAILGVDLAVTVAWVFFRAQNWAELTGVLGKLCSVPRVGSLMALCAGQGPMTFAACWLSVGLLAASYLAPRDCTFRTLRGALGFCGLYLLAIVFLGAPAGGEFIYFQF